MSESVRLAMQGRCDMIKERSLIGMLASKGPSNHRIVGDFESKTVLSITQFADCVPVLIPSGLSAEFAPVLAERIDALLVFGIPADESDALVPALIGAAMAAARPVFGTGGGFSAINSALGGANRRLDPIDEIGEDTLARQQKLTTTVGSVLQRFTASATLSVGGSLCPRIETLGEGLVANAVGKDGAVASISAAHMAAPVFAVNWHPEWQDTNTPHDRAFWHFLGEAARATYLAAPGAGRI